MKIFDIDINIHQWIWGFTLLFPGSCQGSPYCYLIHRRSSWWWLVTDCRLLSTLTRQRSVNSSNELPECLVQCVPSDVLHLQSLEPDKGRYVLLCSCLKASYPHLNLIVSIKWRDLIGSYWTNLNIFKGNSDGFFSLCFVDIFTILPVLVIWIK